MKIRAGIAALLVVAAGCSSGPTDSGDDGDTRTYSGQIAILERGECQIDYTVSGGGDGDIVTTTTSCVWEQVGTDLLVLSADFATASELSEGPSEVLLDRVGEGWAGIVWADLSPEIVHVHQDTGDSGDIELPRGLYIGAGSL